MILFNNRYISNYKLIFLLIDTALLVGAIALGYYLRFLGGIYPINLDRFLFQAFFFTFVFQLSLYYFELYELKIIRDGSKFCFRLAQSVTAAIIVLMIASYMFPILTFGRGVLLLSVTFASSGAFFWRIIYRHFVRGNKLNERILILGTGEFAREIARAIRDKGDSGFEVIGHIIDEKLKGDKA
ncbi:MAG: nucleoside-diphosphate sugar epimerase/dehydratase [Candidatus Hodarchaeota archaeon]